MKPLLLTLVLAGLGMGLAYNQNAPILPDPKLSPGDVLTSDKAIICVSGYTKTVRNVPQSLKEQVYKEYGITSRESGEYEIDHIVSLELGGSNSIRNLFPESYKTQPLNAHVKDTLENKLHALACGGQISMQDAQQAIASNWTAAYVKYVGPLPGGAQVLGSTASTVKVPVLPTPSPVPIQNTAQGSGSATDSALPNTDGSCPSTAPIKVSKSGIYHLPTGDGNYQRTKAKACFASAAAAQAAGYRGIK
ncbi:hypothetical protein GCM10022631_25190 [Deinococcus rubellus]|uniref:HNH endonuclease n=1 Tax=Deinococcus rubellus TaxID=1889240 RepID=A0ABY5YGP3_9DEIO|nr:HNH endonuclease [Deinococcus rubellus]UWX64233.1 HNH endonuclease [Deinococcus rubellus]